MPYAKLGEINIFYEEFGKGKVVLFLHSVFSRGLLAFSGQILPFSGHYRCLFPDFRGHGRTTCESLDWNSRIIADDMSDFLDALDITQAHLIGYSLGAYVGCYLAAKYPDKVKSLVTIGGGAYPRPDGADDFLPENLISRNDTDFIEDMKIRHVAGNRNRKAGQHIAGKHAGRDRWNVYEDGTESGSASGRDCRKRTGEDCGQRVVADGRRRNGRTVCGARRGRQRERAGNRGGRIRICTRKEKEKHYKAARSCTIYTKITRFYGRQTDTRGYHARRH